MSSKNAKLDLYRQIKSLQSLERTVSKVSTILINRKEVDATAIQLPSSDGKGAKNKPRSVRFLHTVWIIK
jgi:hypothetical protein